MNLKINLASRSYLNRRQFNAVAIAAFLVMGVLLIANIGNVSSNAGDITSTARQIAHYEGKLSGVIPEKDYQDVLSKISFANSIIDRKAFNWIALLDKLENVVPDGIALSGIDPDPKTDELKISGIAKSFKNLRTFMENLENSQDFKDVYLLSQGEMKIGQTQHGINFKINSRVTLR